MPRKQVLALVLAGGQGGRMEVLTDERAKPALPYAGVYRLIDFSLSNLRNSGISDVWVVVQYETQSISEALANGRPWDLDRTHGGLRVIPPQQESGDEGGWHEGNADAIFRNRDLIREFDPEVLLVLSADHIYRLDYDPVIDQHRESGADVTIVTTQVPLEDASNYGTLKATKDSKVTAFDYKPDEPESNVVTTEIFVYTPSVVVETLEKLSRENSSPEDESSGLEDFGHQLLPYLVEHANVREYRMDGYWKDVGRPETYFQSHMDLLAEHPELNLDDPQWPIFTLEPQRMPARVHAAARIDRSLISPGCIVDGTVERCVLAPGVVVEEGAIIRNTIVLHDTVIRARAEVQYAIIDGDVTIGENAQVGQKPKGDAPTSDELVLIGSGAKIKKGAKLERGARVEVNGQA